MLFGAARVDVRDGLEMTFSSESLLQVWLPVSVATQDSLVSFNGTETGAFTYNAAQPPCTAGSHTFAEMEKFTIDLEI